MQRQAWHAGATASCCPCGLRRQQSIASVLEETQKSPPASSRYLGIVFSISVYIRFPIRLPLTSAYQVRGSRIGNRMYTEMEPTMPLVIPRCFLSEPTHIFLLLVLQMVALARTSSRGHCLRSPAALCFRSGKRSRQSLGSVCSTRSVPLEPIWWMMQRARISVRTARQT